MEESEYEDAIDETDGTGAGAGVGVGSWEVRPNEEEEEALEGVIVAR